jgi:hypothetical protein
MQPQRNDAEQVNESANILVRVEIFVESPRDLPYGLVNNFVH